MKSAHHCYRCNAIVSPMKNKLLTLGLIAFGIVGCTTIPTLTDGSIQCINNQTKSLDFSYHPKNAQQWHYVDNDVMIYFIDTVDGKQIVLNSLELENYKCSPVNPK